MEFSQTFLKPGRYHVGGNRYKDFRPGDIRRIVQNTEKLLESGNQVPVILEHAEPGSEEGSPRQTKADRVKNGTGWLKQVKANDDGSAEHVLEITDSRMAEKLKNGSVKFTSPEIRTQAWKDGKGREFTDFISHVALTHKPRNVDQSKLEPVESTALSAMQFSLADQLGFVEIVAEDGTQPDPLGFIGNIDEMQVTNEDKMLGKEAMKQEEEGQNPPNWVLDESLWSKAKEAVKPDDNPSGFKDPWAVVAHVYKRMGGAVKKSTQMAGDDDMPSHTEEERKKMMGSEHNEEPNDDLNDIMPDESAKQMEAIVALLAEMGVALPADTTMDTFVRDLLTALKTAAMIKKQADAKEEPEEKEEPVVEATPAGQQFSLAEIESSGFGHPLLAKVVKQSYQSTMSKIDDMVKASKINPATKAALLKERTFQFSENGDEQASYSLEQLAEILDESLVPGQQLSTEETDGDFTTVEHPQGESFFEDDSGDLSHERAKQYNDRMEKQHPGLFVNSK